MTKHRRWPWIGPAATDEPLPTRPPAAPALGFADLFGDLPASIAEHAAAPPLSLGSAEMSSSPPPPVADPEQPAPATAARLPDPEATPVDAHPGSTHRVAPAHHTAPRDLEVTPSPPARALAIGSCFLENLLGSLGDGEEGLHTDFVLVNGIEDFPAAPPADIAAYAYQIVQVPLRFVMHDDAVLHLDFDDIEGHETAFQRSCALLRLQLDNRLRWATPGLPTFVFNFMQPQYNAMGRFFPRYDLRNPAFFVQRLNQELDRLLASHPGTHLLDLDGLAASFGRRYVQDDTFTACNHAASFSPFETIKDRMEALAPLGAHYHWEPGDQFREAIADELRAMMRTLRQADAVKLIVTDLDDTLWMGVSGDTADIGPHMAETWPIGYVEALHYARKRGIVLAICSKNDESRIRAIWRSIFGTRLSLEDFGAIRINWRPKAENMAEILAAMNLLPRNVLFIDDNPVERAAMRSAFPGIRTIGENPFHTRRIILAAAETQTAVVTAESARRTQMIQAQMARETLRQAASPEEFARDQQTAVTISLLVSPMDKRFARALELINKTNQFNTTGRRWSMAECLAFFGGGGEVTVFDVEDRFTPYGLVGVVLVQDGTIVQWVMSCRVIGMRVEQAVMATLVARLRARGIGAIRALLTTTDANQPCRTLYAQSGFSQSGADWILDAGDAPSPPAHVAIHV